MNQRFFIPNYMLPSYMNTIRNPSLINKLFGNIKGFNWGGLLTNANKTLNVVNQTIPLVKQAGPIYNNMKSMLRVARAFGNETTSNNNKSSNNIINNNSQVKEEIKEVNILNSTDDESPSFFI